MPGLQKVQKKMEVIKYNKKKEVIKKAQSKYQWILNLYNYSD